MAELDRIIYQIVKYLLDLYHVCIDVHLLAGQYQFDRNQFAAAGSFKGGSRIFNDWIDVKICPVEDHSLRIEIIEG